MMFLDGVKHISSCTSTSTVHLTVSCEYKSEYFAVETGSGSSQFSLKRYMTREAVDARSLSAEG